VRRVWAAMQAAQSYYQQIVKGLIILAAVISRRKK
jgi:ribose/xylose/arabinose/galactoside ABC-type transport system permease subunit